MRTTTFGRGLLAGLALLVAFAPGREARGQDVGDFTAEVRGPWVATLTGWAKSWGSRAENGWYVQLWKPDGTMMLLLFSGDSRPPRGTYPVVDWMANDATPPDGRFVATLSVTGDMLGVVGYHSTEGEVTITESTTGRVSGTFSFRAKEMASATGVAEIDGTFSAPNQEG
jgi:hypothetical protein